MLHCCRCNKSRSPKDQNKSNKKLKDHQIEQKLQQVDHQQMYIAKIRENEQMILKMHKELQDENTRLKSLINSLEQEKLELQEKYNQLQIQSIQFIPQSHSRSILEETNIHFSTKQQSFQFNDPSNIKYQSLKKLYDELIKDKDWDVQKKNQYSSSIQFLNNILQQKQEDLELAQAQIIKQNKIIEEYELKYNQLLQDYQQLEQEYYEMKKSFSEYKTIGLSYDNLYSGIIQEAIKLNPQKIVIKTIN